MAYCSAWCGPDCSNCKYPDEPCKYPLRGLYVTNDGDGGYVVDTWPIVTIESQGEARLFVPHQFAECGMILKTGENISLVWD